MRRLILLLDDFFGVLAGFLTFVTVFLLVYVGVSISSFCTIGDVSTCSYGLLLFSAVVSLLAGKFTVLFLNKIGKEAMSHGAGVGTVLGLIFPVCILLFF